MQTGIGERPTVPFGLSLAGLVVSAVAALVVGIAGLGMFGTFGYGSMMGGMMGGYYGGTGMMNGYSPWGMSGWGAFTWIWVPWLVASIAIAALGVFLLNSSSLEDVRIGSVLVLVGAVLAFPTFFGFVVGSLLMVLGGIFGLVWSPTQQTRL
ncbi:MAG TPA: hypothetical protein VFE96_04795 [Candidatus Bathyarchaeia archaeon]|jgi:hypothetical protein|nr:hypothetical protein [Candidatus Bathyarchaeia archaeon]